jgi:hypothetical protein
MDCSPVKINRHMFTYLYTFLHTYLHTFYIHFNMFTYVHTFLHTYVHTFLHTYLHTFYIHFYMFTYVHTRAASCSVNDRGLKNKLGDELLSKKLSSVRHFNNLKTQALSILRTHDPGFESTT